MNTEPSLQVEEVGSKNPAPPCESLAVKQLEKEILILKARTSKAKEIWIPLLSTIVALAGVLSGVLGQSCSAKTQLKAKQIEVTFEVKRAEKRVLIRRQLIEAEKHRKDNDYAQAVKLYEKLLESDTLTEDWRKQVTEERLAALPKRPVFLLARQHLKFPDAADYEMRGMASIAENGKVPVHGDIHAPNAFGVKGHFSTSCDVTFSADKPSVRVRLFMFQPDEPLSSISAENIEVDL
jgi:hypothetical protein